MYVSAYWDETDSVDYVQKMVDRGTYEETPNIKQTIFTNRRCDAKSAKIMAKMTPTPMGNRPSIWCSQKDEVCCNATVSVSD
jgi:hypothetical protein